MNTVILIGRLTRDPELKYTPNGNAVSTFTLAVDKPFGDKEADFIPIVVWQKLAESCANHLNKGRLVAVNGRLQIRNYNDKDGNKRKAAEVVANSVKFLDWGKKGEKSEPAAESDDTWDGVNLDDLPF